MSKARYTDTFNSFIQNTDNLVQLYEERAQKAAQLPAGLTDTSALPAELLQLFDEYDEAKQQFRLELIDLAGYIAVRFPEIKEEDNAGVRVQEEVRTVITGILYGSKEGKQDFEISKTTFLEERAKIVAPKEGKDGKDGEKPAEDPEAAQLKALRLADLTRKQFRALQLGWRNLQIQRDTVATFIQNNKDKLTEPRRSNSRYHN